MEVTSSEWFHFHYLAEALGYAGPEAKSKPCILEPFSLPGQSSLSHYLLTSFVGFHIDQGEAFSSAQRSAVFFSKKRAVMLGFLKLLDCSLSLSVDTRELR